MINKWLLNGENSPDVIYWQSGARLIHIFPMGMSKDITALWQQQNFDRYFRKLRTLCNSKTSTMRFHFLTIHGAFIMCKSFLMKMGRGKTWDQLLSQCRSLKKMDRYFSAIPLKEHWPVAAWFDYLNLNKRSKVSPWL